MCPGKHDRAMIRPGPPGRHFRQTSKESNHLLSVGYSILSISCLKRKTTMQPHLHFFCCFHTPSWKYKGVEILNCAVLPQLGQCVILATPFNQEGCQVRHSPRRNQGRHILNKRFRLFPVPLPQCYGTVAYLSEWFL